MSLGRFFFFLLNTKLPTAYSREYSLTKICWGWICCMYTGAPAGVSAWGNQSAQGDSSPLLVNEQYLCSARPRLTLWGHSFLLLPSSREKVRGQVQQDACSWQSDSALLWGGYSLTKEFTPCLTYLEGHPFATLSHRATTSLLCLTSSRLRRVERVFTHSAVFRGCRWE